MTTVRHVDLRALGYCNPGARAWFRRRGLEWHKLLREGIPAATLAALGDAMADRVIEKARRREEAQGDA